MFIFRVAVLAQETAQPVSEKADLYPKSAELIAAAVAFAIIFFFFWKWVLPRVNTLLEERRQQIQGQLEEAEDTKRRAAQELEEYRAQLANDLLHQWPARIRLRDLPPRHRYPPRQPGSRSA